MITVYHNFYNGTAWVPHSGQLIAESELTGVAASVSFASLLGDFAHLSWEVVARSDDAGTNTTLNIRLNNDSGSNYHYERQKAAGTSVTAELHASQTEIGLGFIAADGGPAGFSSSSEGKILHYSDTTFYTSGLGATFGHVSGSSTLRHDNTGFFWANTVAVNRIDFFPGAGSFKAGSKFSLYGLM